MVNKKVSPQAVFALKEALSVIFWKKDELRDFIKLIIEHKSIVSTIDWGKLKRNSVKELIDRMVARQDLYIDDLLNIIIAVCDFTDFPHLEFWDDDGSKRKKATQAVVNLRKHAKGYIVVSQEAEEIRKRKIEASRRISDSQSIESELGELKNTFYKIAANSDRQRRGYQLEEFLNNLFHLYELDPKGSFKNKGEQIDGAFTFEGIDYLLEAKWKHQVGRSDLASFCYKVESKTRITMGLFVTMEGVTPEAISSEFKSIIIMDGSDIVAIIEGRVSFPDLLYKKRRRAAETGQIFVRFCDL